MKQSILKSSQNSITSLFLKYTKDILILFMVFVLLPVVYSQPGELPEDFSERSEEGLETVYREMEFWNGLETLIAWGSIVNIALTEPEINLATDGEDVTVAAEALARLPDAMRGRINEHIDFIVADPENELSPEEVEFWENFRELINIGHSSGFVGRDANDPHIVTFDGLRYAFQAAGEFVLLRCNNGMMEIQTRQSPIRSSLAANSAIAMNVWGDNVSVYMSGQPEEDTSSPLRVNNQVIPIGKSPVALKNGGVIRFNKKKLNDIEVTWPTGEKALIYTFHSEGFKYLNVLVTIPNSNVRKYEGLLGDANTDPNDDLRFQDGKVMEAEPAYFEVTELINLGGRLNNSMNKAKKTYQKKLTRKFGESWRITDQTSLFSYKAGQSTASYTDRSFPEDYHTLGDLTTEELRQARETCEAEGVTGDEMEACVYDVAFSGYQGFAKSAAKMAQAVELIEELGVRVPLKPFLPKNVEQTLKREAEKQLKKKIKFPTGKFGL